MNWPGKASPHTRIRARLSRTRRRATTAWTLARGHSFPAMARDSARPVSKPGSLSPRRKRRAPTSGSVLLSIRLETKEAKVTQLFSRDLAEFPGKEGVMITVEYPPGSTDPIHRHNADAFVYVLEGSIVMQVRGGKEMTLTPGQTFYEGPSDVHVVGRNASQTKPAKFVVFFVKDKGAPILVPAN